MHNSQKQAISFEVIKILNSRFNSFPAIDDSTRNAPFHKSFLNAFAANFARLHTNAEALLNVSSWIHGLNTTLGQSFFETVAHILCQGKKRTFTNNLASVQQVQSVHAIMTELKNGTQAPNREREERILWENINGETESVPNFTVDCFWEDSEKVVAIELKSVRPNSGEMRGEKQKILVSKAALKRHFPNKKIFYYFGFPFDPLSATPTGSNKETFMNSVIELPKFCAPEEILLADELWSFLSGETGTMEQILQIICQIATPEFNENLLFLSSSAYLENKSRYNQLIEKWNLCQEQQISKNIDRLSNCQNPEIRKFLLEPPFSSGGKYNLRRAEVLTAA